MDIREYRIFLNVCKTNNFSKTARNMFITKSAIVQHINKLEKHFEVKLFNRTNHGVSLTTAGQKLLPLAQDIITTDDEIIRTMHDFSNTLTIGTIFLEKPKYISKILSENPKLMEKIKIDFREIKDIKYTRNQVDLIEYYEINKYLDSSFRFKKLKDESIVIAMPPNCSLRKKKKINFKDLEGHTLAIEQSGVSSVSDELIDKLKEYPKIDLKSFGVYDSSFFNTALYNNYLMCIASNMRNYAKPDIIRPLNTSRKAYYGIYYRKKPSKALQKFLTCLSSFQQNTYNGI